MTREEAIKYLAQPIVSSTDVGQEKQKELDAYNMAIKALEQQTCEDAVSRNLITQTLNKMDRYVAEELTLCDTDKKFPKNEVFVVDDVYEQIVEQLPSVQSKTEVCEDVISRKAVLNCFDNHFIDNYEVALAKRRVKKLPSVQSEQRTGHWIDEGIYADGSNAHAYRCSECEGHIIEYEPDDFCKFCGAKMVETQESEE